LDLSFLEHPRPDAGMYAENTEARTPAGSRSGEISLHLFPAGPEIFRPDPQLPGTSLGLPGSSRLVATGRNARIHFDHSMMGSVG
jgi:hypothetical protein